MNRTDIKYDLTIGMIVKNEEKYLERCLKAMLPLKEEIKCEIIVTDTGSTDRTVEIAEKYADKVLHFEWCDDFSAARNTGVDVSEGAWFMFADADEIFDESVMEIAKFMKNIDRDKYDNAFDIIVNYIDEKGSKKMPRTAVRLFNFTSKKRCFVSRLHEYIPRTNNSYYIKAYAHHYGYLVDVLNVKYDRNSKILKQELEKHPNELGLYKYLYDATEGVDKIDVALKGIDVYDNDKENNYENLVDISAINALYDEAIRYYLTKHEFQSAIDLSEKYLSSDIIKLQQTQDKIPMLNVTYMYAESLYFTKEYKKSIKYYKDYKRIYDLLQKNPDTIFDSTILYPYNKKIDYAKSLAQILGCYEYLNDEINVVKCLKEYKIYRYNEDSSGYIFLSHYVKFCVKYNQNELFDDVKKFISSKVDIYKNYAILFYAKFMLTQNIDDYLENSNISTIIKFIGVSFNSQDDFVLDAMYKFITNKTEYSTLKEMVVYLRLMNLYILNKSIQMVYVEEDSTQDDSSDTMSFNFDDDKLEDKELLNEIFELYIKKMYLYVKTVYNQNILDTCQYDLLGKVEVFCYEVYPALEQKNSNPIEYIKALKDSLKYYLSYKDAVNIAIDLIEENLSNEGDNKPEPNNEFQMLSERIKLAIIEAIKSNQIEKAKLIIEEYKKINPTDPDIGNLSNLIKN